MAEKQVLANAMRHNQGYGIMAQLMQGGRVVVVGGGELAPVGKVDAVGRGPVERAITRRVRDRRTGRFQDVLGALDGALLQKS